MCVFSFGFTFLQRQLVLKALPAAFPRFSTLNSKFSNIFYSIVFILSFRDFPILLRFYIDNSNIFQISHSSRITLYFQASSSGSSNPLEKSQTCKVIHINLKYLSLDQVTEFCSQFTCTESHVWCVYLTDGPSPGNIPRPRVPVALHLCSATGLHSRSNFSGVNRWTTMYHELQMSTSAK